MNLQALRHNLVKDRLLDSFYEWQQSGRGRLGDDLIEYMRELVYRRFHTLERDDSFRERGTAQTADDWAQETTLRLLANMTTDSARAGYFRGSSRGEFWNWVSSNARLDAKNKKVGYLLTERKRNVPLEVPTREEDAEAGETVDSAEIYEIDDFYPFAMRDAINLGELSLDEEMLIDSIAPTQIGHKDLVSSLSSSQLSKEREVKERSKRFMDAINRAGQSACGDTDRLHRLLRLSKSAATPKLRKRAAAWLDYFIRWRDWNRDKVKNVVKRYLSRPARVAAIREQAARSAAIRAEWWKLANERLELQRRMTYTFRFELEVEEDAALEAIAAE